jgi:hypothetical protein
MYSPAMHQQGYGQQQQQQGFNFVDNDGRYHDVGYSKNLAEVIQSAVTTPPMNKSPAQEKRQEAGEYFGPSSQQKQ